MIVTRDSFEKAVITAINTEATVFDSMESYLKTAENYVRITILGDVIYNDFNSLPEDIKNSIASLISLKGFADAIPFLDLILTPTGFGVVSTETLAPASKERVDRLLSKVIYAAEDATDLLILNLHASLNDKWSKTNQFTSLIDSLFWTAEDLRKYGGMPSAHRSDLLSSRSKIWEAEELIKKKISSEFYKEILDSMRKRNLSPENTKILHFMKILVGHFLSGAIGAFNDGMDSLINVLEANIENFKTYAGSTAYQIKHFQHYENNKEDSTFFFG